MVTASAPFIPNALQEQLVEGGRMIVPVGDDILQRLTLIEWAEDRFIERPSIPVRFVKLIGQAGHVD